MEQIKFKNNLLSLRNETKLSQQEFGKMFGIKQGTYCNYEKGITEPSIEVMIRIADHFKVSLDYIFNRPFSNNLGHLTENQSNFFKTFLCLSETNQMKTVIYVANLLAKE